MNALSAHRSLLLAGFILFSLSVFSQSPGGVSSGTVRGWKAELFNGTFGTNFNAFGTGGSNTTPTLWGYAGYINGDEFLGYRADYFGLQYSGILEVPQTGAYQFNVYNIDDHAELYIDGVRRAVYNWSGSLGNITATVTLSAGDHTIQLKYIEVAGAESVQIRWSGPGITSNADLDGRFVRVDNAPLAAWYDASNITFTPNYSGDRSRLNAFVNKAPAFSGQGNISNLSTGWAQLNTNAINFNPAGRFDGDDWYSNASNQNGLALRSAPRSSFLVSSFLSNTTGASWLWGQSGDATGTNAVGMWKQNGTQTGMGRNGDTGPFAVSTYAVNEPKLLTGSIRLATSNSASVNNSRSMSANGGTAVTTAYSERISNFASTYGIQFGAFLNTYTSEVHLPELIYYPFELTTEQSQRVNTYLGIKYGITLQHNYLSTSGTVLWNNITNATYHNRVFGIGRELAVGGLNQKQSQSQMGTGSQAFLVLSKGAIAVNNAANTGGLSDGDYMIIGDNNGALAAQATEIPTSFTATTGCTAARLTREWKVQTAGNPGPVTLRAGASGAYLFPSGAAGLSLLVDVDGDGNFTTGTVNSYPAAVNSAGVATFNNVTIPNGAVITFAWSVTAPGGVFSSLALWLKADGELYSDVAGTTPATNGNAVALWRDGSTLGNSVSQTTAGIRPIFRNNAADLVNFNPVLQFTLGTTYLQTSSISTALNGNVTGFSAHKFGGNTSGWNGILGSRRGNPQNGWNIYVSQSSGLYSLWTATGSIWTPHDGTLAGTQPDLISFSAALGTGAKYLYERGRQTAAGSTNYAANTTNQFQVGSTGDGTNNFGGTIYEQIVYSSILSNADRRKVESYLAIKYGTPIDQTTAQNYTNSDGTVIWNGTTHATYKNNVFGIGRDDCSGLMQKQSQSSVAGDHITVALSSVAVTNADNAGAFNSNKQFLLIGHDGAALSTTAIDIPASFTAVSCNARRYAREWKVQHTGSVGAVTIAVGNAGNKIKTSMTNLHLVVDTDGDGNFSTGTPVLYAVQHLQSGVATFNNVVLPDNAVFTLCWTEAAPGGVMAPTSGTTAIGGVPHLNGLSYDFYTGTTTEYPGVLDVGSLSSMPGTLVSSGYLSNLTDVQLLVTQHTTLNIGMEIRGKINIPVTSGTWRFQADGLDDNASIRIDGVSVFNGAYSAGNNITGSNVSLTAGYHDVVIRFSQGGGNIRWSLSWNSGSGSSFVAIPDANLFTVFTGPSAWYASDDIQLQNHANGANLGVISGTKWPDMSASGNDLTIVNSGGNPLYYSTSNAYLRNYNPSVYFSDDYLSTSANVNGLALGGLGKTMFGVAQNSANGATRFYSSIGHATSGVNTHQFGILKRSTNALSIFTYGNDINESAPYFYNSANITTDIISGTLTTGRAATVYANGASRLTGTLSAFSTWLANTRMINMGGSSSETSTYTGNMNEIIHYPWALSAMEQQKVNSYLAVKWGITLDQTTPTNYLAADGTVTWTGDATFRHDITGIGRDDCSALNQLQSTSTDGDDMVTISKGVLAANNYVHTASFDTDKQYVIVGHNNAAAATLNTTNMPTALASVSACYTKMSRVWKVKTTGSVGGVQLQLGKQGLFVFNKSYYKPKLIISANSTNFSAATVVDADSVSNGLVYFSNVTFTGDQYFTVAIIQAAPGGVTANLNLWLAADDGTDAKTDNTVITNWTDLSLQNMHATGVNGPVYRSGNSVGASNFNPTITLNGSTHRFTLPTGFANFTAGVSFFSVTNAGTAGNWGRIMQLGTSATQNNDGIVFTRQTTSNNAGIEIFPATGGSLGTLYTTVADPLASGAFNIIDWNIESGSSGQTGKQGSIGVNGESITTATSLATPPNTSRSVNTIGGRGGNNLFAGNIPELVLYNRQVTALEKQKIQSYLAVKYGRTLSNTIGNYVNSAGNNIYGYATHWNRITAIGRDDCQALEQKQSKSAEAGGLVTIGIGSTVATSNETNTNLFTTDNSFAAFGDNGRAATWTGVDNIGNGLVRLNRIWRVQETGTIGTVYIEVPGSSSLLSNKLPASDAATDPVYLVVNNNNNFKTTATLIEMIPDVIGATTKWYTTYNFTNGDYFTFATKKLCLGPAGITDGLTTWYRADNKVTVPTTFNDETGAHALTRSGTASLIAGSATSFNYNKSITLSTGAAFTKGGLTNADVTSANAGAMFAVGTVSSSLFRIGVTNSDATGVSINAAFGTSVIPFGAIIAGKPNILGMNAAGTTLTALLNGTSTQSTTTLARPNTTPHILGLGRNGGDATNFNNGTIGEAFSLNRGLTTHEQQVLNSYLAIKYGQTLSHNYYSPDYDGTNAATATLYNVGSYSSRIFGVGVDSTGCLYQKQSTSQLDGSLLKISITNTLATENTANTGQFTKDRTYLVGGDNNGAINSWTTGVTPAIYNAAHCNIPVRIARQWKFKATNNHQPVLITIPGATNAATTKLPAFTGGATKVFMVVNNDEDFSTNAGMEEFEMTWNATSREWEVNYSFAENVYKYIGFVAKAEFSGLIPIAIATGTQDAVAADCNATPYLYYRGTTNTANAIIAVNPNGNTWSPTSISINNQGTLTGGGGTFSNSGTGYYQSTDGVNSLRVTKRLSTIVAPGTYDLSDGVLVRVYYADADISPMLSDPLPGSASILRQGWFKFPGNAAATVAAMTPTNLPAEEITPVASGTEQGVRYVEFLVNSFSTFGYFAKTTSAILPVELEYFKGNTTNCENTLSWKSSEELNFSYYELQSSIDGLQFSSVGIQFAKGAGVYEMKHVPATVAVYYRLKMTDKDGTNKYSAIVKLNNDCAVRQISVYPNPVQNVLTISGAKQGSVIRISDAGGRTVIAIKADAAETKIQLTAITKGIYFVEITNPQNGERKFIKILKE